MKSKIIFVALIVLIFSGIAYFEYPKKIEINPIVYPLPTNLTWNNPATKIINGETRVYVESQSVSELVLFGFDYDKKLTAAGWVQDNTLAADGINASNWGYKKGNDRVGFSWVRTPLLPQDPDRVGTSCPCTNVYRIYTWSK